MECLITSKIYYIRHSRTDMFKQPEQSKLLIILYNHFTTEQLLLLIEDFFYNFGWVNREVKAELET